MTLDNDRVLIPLFAALGDPVRLAIAERLIANGAHSVDALGGIAAISAPAMSRHLEVLRQAGVVTQTVDRQRRIYAINPGAMQSLDTWVTTRRAFWMASLDRLAAALEEED